MHPRRWIAFVSTLFPLPALAGDLVDLFPSLV